MTVAACLCILAGTMGLTLWWYDNYTRMLHVARQWQLLLGRWEQNLSTERMRMPDFLKRYVDCPYNGRFIGRILERLQQRSGARTQEIWSEAVQESYPYVSSELTELLLLTYQAFFAPGCGECIRMTQYSLSAYERYEQECRREFARKQKLYLPGGVLLGLFLIVLFL